MTRRASFLAAGVVALALGACAPTPNRTAIPLGSPMSAGQLPYGTWRVSGYRFVGVSGMSRNDADGWIGRTASFSRTTAGFPPDVCAAPDYAVSSVTLADLAADYRVRPSDLGIAGATVQVVEVRCQDAWSGPGNRLLVLSPGHIVCVWDGVFFDLTRAAP